MAEEHIDEVKEDKEVKDVKNDSNETAETTGKSGKKKFFTESRIELLVAIFLGITALLTAWATWIGSLHGGNQATNYTKSNNLASEGNSEYNSGLQNYLSDLMAYNTMIDYLFEEEIAKAEGDTAKAELIAEKYDNYVEENGSEILHEALKWQEENDADSPFDMPGVYDKYFETANELLEESRALLKEGQQDNTNGDTYNLVNVIYSLVLFMLGVVGIFKKLPNRAVVLIIAIVALILATIYMFTIPMPTGFSLGSYF